MITRRKFLTQGAALVGAGLAAPNLLMRTAFAAEENLLPGADPDTILVLIQMAGGNDSLNTVIPYNDPLYYQYRNKLAIPKADIAYLNENLGLHPSLASLAKRFEDGQVAVVNGVGYPKPNRSHFIATDIWQTGSPDDPKGTGWIGRFNDHAVGTDDRQFKAVGIGGDLPGALKSSKGAVPAIRDLSDFRFFPSENGGQRADDMAAFKKLHKTETAYMKRAEFLRGQTLNAYSASENLQKVVGRYRAKVNYPNSGLGRQLRLIGQMIASPIRARTYHATIGGFDTHANQAPNHARILGDLATATDAFLKDLEDMGKADKVLVMTYSEFGRRVAENGSAGTDHGAAGALFVMGHNLKGGIYGEHPGLQPEQLDRGDLKWHTDFRQVYSTVLTKWLGCAPEPVLGQAYENLAFLS